MHLESFRESIAQPIVAALHSLDCFDKGYNYSDLGCSKGPLQSIHSTASNILSSCNCMPFLADSKFVWIPNQWWMLKELSMYWYLLEFVVTNEVDFGWHEPSTASEVKHFLRFRNME